MSKRNFYKELCFSNYVNGNDTETICYPSLICVITELCDRIEQLEARLNVLDPLWKIYTAGHINWTNLMNLREND